MNLGIYVSNIGDQAHMQHVAECINNSLLNKRVEDASLFYDNIGFNPFNIRCGSFNSTDIWNFNGDLIINNLNSLRSALNIVNDIDVYYYHGWEEINVLQLLSVIGKNFKVICNSQDSANEFYRLTNTEPLGVIENYNGILDLIMESSNGRTKNSRDVCTSK